MTTTFDDDIQTPIPPSDEAPRPARRRTRTATPAAEAPEDAAAAEAPTPAPRRRAPARRTAAAADVSAAATPSAVDEAAATQVPDGSAEIPAPRPRRAPARRTRTALEPDATEAAVPEAGPVLEAPTETLPAVETAAEPVSIEVIADPVEAPPQRLGMPEPPGEKQTGPGVTANPGVILLPWIRVKAPIKIGRYSLISTDDARITKRLEPRFKAFLNRHRGRNGNPVAEAAVLAIDDNAVLRVTPDELAEATSWIPVFFALTNEAVAFRQNMAVAENFDWIFHPLSAVEEGIVMETGSVLKERGYLGPSDKVSFQIPAAANPECVAMADPDIVEAMSRVMQSGDTVTANLVRRSSELLLQAFVNDQRISAQTRLLLIFFSLETILEADDRKNFRIKIDQWCGTSAEPRTPFQIRTRRRNRDLFIKIDLTEKQVWANEFYELRNRITHEPIGGQEMNYKNGQAHFWIAFDFYRLALHRRLSASTAAQPFASLADVEESEGGEFVFKRQSFRRKQDVDRGLIGPKTLGHHSDDGDEAESGQQAPLARPAPISPEVEAAQRLLAQGEAIARRRLNEDGSFADVPEADAGDFETDSQGKRKRRRRRGGKNRPDGQADNQHQQRPAPRDQQPRDQQPRFDDDVQPRNVDHRKTRSMWSDLFPSRRGGGNRW